MPSPVDPLQKILLAAKACVHVGPAWLPDQPGGAGLCAHRLNLVHALATGFLAELQDPDSNPARHITGSVTAHEIWLSGKCCMPPFVLHGRPCHQAGSHGVG